MAKAVCALIAPVVLAVSVPGHAQYEGDNNPGIEAVLDESERDIAPSIDPSKHNPPAAVIDSSAQSPAQSAIPQGLYDIGPILIRGASVLGQSDFVDIIEDYSARQLGQRELSDLTDRIAGRARDLGYVFASAWIEPQSLDTGVLRVSLDEGTIDEIRNIGDDDPAIHSQLAPLLGGQPVTVAELERQILLADDIAGIWIRSTQYVRDGRRGVLVVDARRSRYRASVELDNSGTETIGPYRARLNADVNGLLNDTDRLSLTYSTTPLQPDELQYGRLRYQVVLNSAGTRLEASASYSEARPGAYLEEADILGDSWSVTLGFRHPLIRSRDASVWVEGSAEMRQLQQELLGFTYRRDRVPVLRAGFYSDLAVAGGRLRGRVTYSRGFDVLDATKQGDPLASRSDASARFSKLQVWSNWTGPLVRDFSLSLTAQGQIASAPLLISEDMGLGGRNFLRGYSYNQNTGDQGIMGSAELRYDWRDAFGMLRKVQLYAFADAGYVSNLQSGIGTGSLASSGGGFRAELTRSLNLDLEVALPLTEDRYDTDDKEPQINFRLRKGF